MQTKDDKVALLIKTIGEIVKKHRENSGKSIYKIAAKSSMSKST